MSRTPARPDPGTARSTGTALFGALAFVYVAMLPDAFAVASYVGVLVTLALVMALFGVACFLWEDEKRVWWYAFAEGWLSMLGVVLNRLYGFPVTEAPASQDGVGEWFSLDGMALGFAGLCLVLLSSWVLLSRRTKNNRGSGSRNRLYG